LKKENF